MNIRQPHTVLPTYANFTVIDWKRGEVVLNLCFAEGSEKSPTATVIHKVVMNTENFQRLIQSGQEVLDRHTSKFSDA